MQGPAGSEKHMDAKLQAMIELDRYRTRHPGVRAAMVVTCQELDTGAVGAVVVETDLDVKTKQVQEWDREEGERRLAYHMDRRTGPAEGILWMIRYGERTTAATLAVMVKE